LHAAAHQFDRRVTSQVGACGSPKLRTSLSISLKLAVFEAYTWLKGRVSPKEKNSFLGILFDTFDA
jgi:hypothetical protein